MSMGEILTWPTIASGRLVRDINAQSQTLARLQVVVKFKVVPGGYLAYRNAELPGDAGE